MKFWRKSKPPQRRPIPEGQDEFNAKMARAEALTESNQTEAIELASDDNYYIAEKAVLALLTFREPAEAFTEILKSGSDQARILVLQAIRHLADEQPQAITDDVFRVTTEQLNAEDADTRFVATKTMLYLATALPERTTTIESQLRKSLPGIFPATVDRFADARFTRSQVAGFLADLCSRVPETTDLVVASLHGRRPALREGIARTICRISIPAERVIDDLVHLVETDPEWPVRAWAAAAWEAVAGHALPVECWPVARGVWQMVFFELDNDDDVPAGTRFDEESPLIGVLKQEGDSLWLYWPDDHGVTSSDRLLDDYEPLLVDGLTDDASDLLGQPVAITGTYRNHKISAETVELRRRGSGEET